MKNEKILKSTTQKSYYNKAIIIEDDNTIQLKSYNTIVLELDKKTNTIKKLWQGWSKTTQNHINDFLRLYGFDAITKKQWEKMTTKNDKKQLYKIKMTNGFCDFTPNTIFDDYDDACNYAEKLQQNNNFWSYIVIKI